MTKKHVCASASVYTRSMSTGLLKPNVSQLATKNMGQLAQPLLRVCLCQNALGMSYSPLLEIHDHTAALLEDAADGGIIDDTLTQAKDVLIHSP